MNKQKIGFKVENAHNDYISKTCYESDESPIIFSGSDDTSIKVLDKRLSNSKVAGALLGRKKGVTCVTSQNDGFH